MNIDEEFWHVHVQKKKKEKKNYKIEECLTIHKMQFKEPSH